MDDKDKPAQQECRCNQGQVCHVCHPIQCPVCGAEDYPYPKCGCVTYVYPMDDEAKPEPADNQLLWIVMAFIALMLTLLTIRSCI